MAEYEDAGISGGFLLARPGMQAAIAGIQTGRADTLICASISRYSRDTEHQQSIRKAVRAAGGSLIFCDMDFDDTPEGDLAFGVMGTFAEYERKVIRARTMRGRRNRAANGVQPGRAWSPYGYTIPKTKDIIAGTFPPETLGQYLVNEEEAEVLRWLFAEYATGNYSLPELAKELNSTGVPTKQGAAFWQSPTIRAILVNTAYLGKPKYGRLTHSKDEKRLGEIRPATGLPYVTPDVRRLSDPEYVIELSSPALVDQATWDAVQECLATNKARRGGNPHRVHLLSGSVVCEFCGGKMQINGGSTRKGHAAGYTCGQQRTTNACTGKHVCTAERFKLPIVEEGVIAAIESAVNHPEWVVAALRTYRKAQYGQAGPSSPRMLEKNCLL